MLRRIRTWLARNASATAPPTAAASRRAAEHARHDRAETIIQLRTDVRRLQQEIKDVSDQLDTGVAGRERALFEGRLAAFHDQLEHKQAELSRLQGRV